MKTSDGKFVTYRRMEYSYNLNTPFTKLTDETDYLYKGAKNNTFMHVSFEDNFELFSYDYEKGEYVCSEDISAITYKSDGTVDERKIYCYDITVRIVDGKINYISMNYYFEDEGRELYLRTLTYENIGMTVVKVPSEVVEGATNTVE